MIENLNLHICFRSISLGRQNLPCPCRCRPPFGKSRSQEHGHDCLSPVLVCRVCLELLVSSCSTPTEDSCGDLGPSPSTVKLVSVVRGASVRPSRPVHRPQGVWCLRSRPWGVCHCRVMELGVRASAVRFLPGLGAEDQEGGPGVSTGGQYWAFHDAQRLSESRKDRFLECRPWITVPSVRPPPHPRAHTGLGATSPCGR